MPALSLAPPIAPAKKNLGLVRDELMRKLAQREAIEAVGGLQDSLSKRSIEPDKTYVYEEPKLDLLPFPTKLPEGIRDRPTGFDAQLPEQIKRYDKPTGFDTLPQVSPIAGGLDDGLRERLNKLSQEPSFKEVARSGMASGEGGVNPKEFKTPDEYVKAQGKPLYHGTNAEFDKFDLGKTGTLKTSDWGTKGIYFDPNKSGADYYRQEAVKSTDNKANELYDAYVAKAKEFGTTPMNSSIDLWKTQPEKYNELEEYSQRWRKELRRAEEDTSKGRVVEAYIGKDAKVYKHFYEAGMITDNFLADNKLEEGYDVVEIWDRDADGSVLSEVIVMNPDVIKTKAQLRKEWKDAQGE